MQSTQVALDAIRYQQRLEDASRYSRTLLQSFPVEVIKAPLGSRTSGSEYVSYDKYRRRLYEINRNEYDFVPSLKKQKLGIDKVVNHVNEQNMGNQGLLELLQRELSGGKAGRWSKMSMGFRSVTKLLSTKADEHVDADHETKDEETPTQPSCEDNKSSVGTAENSVRRPESSVIAKSRDDEIAELEEKLRLQRLSRTSKTDQLFYDRLAERELNIILEEVLLEEIYDIAADVFDEEEEKTRNKQLPPDLLKIVEDALHEGPMEEILIQKYNVDIKRHNLQCLLPLQWLNDEVINFYFQMMSDRDEALVNAGVLPKRSHFFNSFFVTKVSETGYNFVNVRRWTRKIDLFAMDKIFMPVNVGNMHWCMAVIFMTEKRIQYYDSMHGSGAACLKVLLRYLHDESEHKKKTKFDDQGWELVTTTPDTPLQTNGSDCGVFSCMFADYLSRNAPLAFVQRDIPFHRHRMVLHITRGYIPLEEEGL